MTDKLVVEVLMAGGQSIDMKHRKLLEPIFKGALQLIEQEVKKQHGVKLHTNVYFV